MHTAKTTTHLLVLGLLLGSAAARADVADSATTEAEHLVPPQGGAFEIPIHAGAVCILSFPEKMSSKALVSTLDYEIKAWGDDGVAVRAIKDNAKPATLALATVSGAIKVNVTIRVVSTKQSALTLVRFKAASADEAFKAAVESEVKKQTDVMAAELATAKADVDKRIRDRADAEMARRLLKRLEVNKLSTHARNDDNVIVHVQRAVFLGEDAYLVFQIENRSGAAYRLASVDVTAPGGKSHAGPARLASGAVDTDDSVIGVVAAGTRAEAVVVLRQVDEVLGKSLALTVSGPEGRGTIKVGRGIVLK